MADPFTIVGSISSVVGIVDAVAKTITTIRSLRNQWNEASLTLMSFDSQLGALKVALLKIQEWMESDPEEAHHLLILNLTSTLQCCEALISKLHEELDDLTSGSSGPPDVSTKIKLLLNSGALSQISKMIESQTSALLLLLTACNTATLSNQSKILQRKSTRKRLESVHEQSASLLVHRDSTSLLSHYTDTLSRQSMVFDFDNDLFSTKVYEPTVRKAFKSALRLQPSRSRSLRNQHEASLESVAEGLEDISEHSSKGYTKVLILGGRGSSKSTILKQLRLLHSDGFRKVEREHWREIIIDNISTALRATIHRVIEEWGLFLPPGIMTQASSTANIINAILDNGIHVDFQDEQSCKSWAEGISDILVEERFEQMLMSGIATSDFTDGIEYLLKRINTIMSLDYLPSDEDIFHASTPTTGIHENSFTSDGQEFRVFDVGGNHLERKKWIHAFEDVDVLLLLAPSNGSHGSFSDDQPVGIPESRIIFESLSNLSRFTTALKFLVLTKTDLLEARIRSGINPFEALEGLEANPSDATMAREDLKRYFTQVYTGQDIIPTHHVDATNTDDVRSIWDVVLKHAKNHVKSKGSTVSDAKSSEVSIQNQKRIWDSVAKPWEANSRIGRFLWHSVSGKVGGTASQITSTPQPPSREDNSKRMVIRKTVSFCQESRRLLPLNEKETRI